jgi:hypothetical protein
MIESDKWSMDVSNKGEPFQDMPPPPFLRSEQSFLN